MWYDDGFEYLKMLVIGGMEISSDSIDVVVEYLTDLWNFKKTQMSRDMKKFT